MMKKYNFYTTSYAWDVILKLVDRFPGKSRLIYAVKYLFIMDRVVRKSERNFNQVPINRNMLSKILGTTKKVSSELIQDLVVNGCLEVVKDYEMGVNSRCFRIPEEHEDGVAVKILSDKTVVKKIVDKKNKLGCNFKETKDGKLYLSYLLSISISPSISSPSSIVFLPMGVICSVTPLKINESNLRRIEEKDFFVIRRDRKSRVYCNLSMLHNGLRRFLRVDGKPLISLDIRNSQPLLSGVMIKSKVKNPSKELSEELDRYIATCNAGLFYEQFMDGEVMSEDERRAFKGKFFEEVFFSRVTKRQTKLKKRFIGQYPLIYEEICKIKGGLNPKDKNSYKKFPINLQRFEASIIFDDVNVSLLRDGYGCFNIYDSIVSHSEEVIEEARKRIIEAFSKYGVTPSFKKEYYA